MGRYYSGYGVVSTRIAFDGLTLVSTRTNSVFDFWNGSRFGDWNPVGNGLCSARWTGFLHVTKAGLHGFGTISDDGSEIWIDGERVVDNHEEPWFDWQEGWCHLGAGDHTLEITFFEHDSLSGIEVWWLRPENAPSVLPYSGGTFHTIPPTFNSGTKWEILGAPVVQTDAPYVDPRLRARPLPSANAVELSWQGFSNPTYVVECSTNLLTWQDWTGTLPGLSGVMTQWVPTTAARVFLRLRLEP